MLKFQYYGMHLSNCFHISFSEAGIVAFWPPDAVAGCRQFQFPRKRKCQKTLVDCHRFALGVRKGALHDGWALEKIAMCASGSCLKYKFKIKISLTSSGEVYRTNQVARNSIALYCHPS